MLIQIHHMRGTMSLQMEQRHISDQVTPQGIQELVDAFKGRCTNPRIEGDEIVLHDQRSPDFVWQAS